MTIAAGFRFADGVLLCSDSLYSDGYLKTEDRKIFEYEYAAIPKLTTAFAFAGVVPYCRMLIDDCRALVATLEEQDATQEAVVSMIREALRQNHDKHLYKHPNYKTGEVSVQLLISVYSPADKKFGCYWTYETAVNEYDDFKCIGQGEFLGHHIAKPLYLRFGMSLEEVFSIAVHMLREVKKSDASCGGSSNFLVHRLKGPFSGLEQLDLSFLEKFSIRWTSAISRAFHIAADWRSTKTEFEAGLEKFAKEMRKLRFSQWRASARQSKELRATVKKLAELRKMSKSAGIWAPEGSITSLSDLIQRTREKEGKENE